MAGLKITVRGQEPAEEHLRRLAQENPEAVDRAMWRWAQAQRARLKSRGYPPQSHKPQPFRTDRSRRFFFWALREGIITVPYRRTTRLANAWRAEREGLMQYVISVASSAPWAGLVVGRHSQARYHAGNWWLAEDEIEAAAPDLTEAIRAELMALAGG